MKFYLASPLGFATATRAFMAEMEDTLAAAGVAFVNPWSSGFGPAFAEAERVADGAERVAALAWVNTAVGRTNAESIQACDGVLAVLDGVDVDSGTASEIGYAFALGKRIYGLRTDSRLTGDNAGTVVNLQVQYFIEASGGRIVRELAAAVALLRAA